MNSLKGILYSSGNIDFPHNQNQWAFTRMQSMRSDQEKRIVLNPEIAPLELSRSPGVDEESTSWLDRLQEILNTATEVNLLRRHDTLRLRKAMHTIDDQQQIFTLVSQDAFNEFCTECWNCIAYFYASRHDGFRFDLVTLITMKDDEPDRENQMDLVTRVVDIPDQDLPSVTFDATGPHAHVNVVDWRGTVSEGESGRFKMDDTRIRILMPQARRPLTFLHERRDEFHNHAWHFSGEKLERQLKRSLRARPSASE